MTTAGHQYTVAALFLQVLAESGVDYLFTVLGSDHASIIEAYQQRQHEGKAWPKMLHFQHEVGESLNCRSKLPLTGPVRRHISRRRLRQNNRQTTMRDCAC